MFGRDDNIDIMLILQPREQTPPPPTHGFLLLTTGGGLELTDGYLLQLAGE